MGNNFDDELLMTYLLKFVCGVPIQSHQIRIVDLCGNNKPSQLLNPSQFLNITTNTVNYVFTPLKKKKTCYSKNIKREIVSGGGPWKALDNSKPIYDRKNLVIGFKKTLRFDEGTHV
ncbi:hypothetical protein T459_04081 [Capsicum annuum]|uniref:NAC domain-containing protein n=1 Tax=Capsicum annuum TaxID=4072 RepID=A0A2G3A418_CAPAN|nr:hypothetical protein T459_04081 [Capsicum annuum]